MPSYVATWQTENGLTISAQGVAADVGSMQRLCNLVDVNIGMASAVIGEGVLSMQAVQTLNVVASSATIPDTASVIRVYAPNATGTLALTIDTTNAVAGQALEIDLMQTSAGTQCGAIVIDGTPVARNDFLPLGSTPQPVGWPYLASPILPSSEGAGVVPFAPGSDAFPIAVMARFTDAGAWSLSAAGPLL